MLCCLALVAAFAFSVVAPASGGADETGGISGTVSGEGGGTLEGVEACVFGSASPSTPIECKTTGSGGTYEITGLAAGQYSVEFTPPALSEYLPGSDPGVTVMAEAVTPNVNATLAKKPPPAPAKITGTVTAEGGGPFEGVDVCLYVSPAQGSSIECKSTDSSGNYEFVGMAPGQYTVEFTPPPLSGYLPGSDPNVTVTAETVTPNVNATLAKKPPPGPGKITGTVSGEGSGTLEGVEVCVFSSASPSTSIECQTTGSAGTYELPGLTAGQYTVEFTPPALGEYLPGSDPGVTVVAETVTPNVNATLAKKPPPAPTEITGTVSAEGGGAFEGVNVCLYPHLSHGALIECKLTDSSGNYEFVSMAPGSYTVEFTPPGAAEYLSQFYLNAASAEQATAVEVTAEHVTPNIDATLAKRPPPGPGEISGQVTAENGETVANVKVCVKQVGAGPLCKMTDPSGEYVFPELQAGKWGVTFNASETGKNLLSLAYPKKEIWEEPTLQTLALGENKNISVVLRTGGQITGTVRSAATGAPVTGVRVCLTEANLFASLACVTTPSTGIYRFTRIWPGSFKVVYSAAAADFPDATPIADGYATQWWNGQPTYGTAVPITVAPSTTITGIDASLVTPIAPAITSSTPIPAAGAVAAATAKPTSKKLKCRKGFTSRKLKGKLRCVKVKQHRKKKSHAKRK